MVYLPMKRGRQGEADSLITMAKCLMLLSRGGGGGGVNIQYNHDTTLSLTSAGGEPKLLTNNSPSRVFECKTCKRQFQSFQALGGHRASHKKPRLIEDLNRQASPAKPKSHECWVCGLEFAMGQALGGHMRRHRATMNDQNQLPLSLSLPEPQVLKRLNSRRVLCVDLNLTPLENDLEFRLFDAPNSPHESHYDHQH